MLKQVFSILEKESILSSHLLKLGHMAGITLISWHHDDVNKSASVCRSMQGRLFVVLVGKDHFIKVRVFAHVDPCSQHKPGLHSHMYCVHCNLAHLSGHIHTQRQAHTLWVSRNRSWVTPLMNPSVILQLNYGRVQSQGTPLRTAPVTWQPSPSPPKSPLSPYLSLFLPLCFLAPSCLNSLSCKVSLSLSTFFFSLIPFICTLRYEL